MKEMLQILYTTKVVPVAVLDDEESTRRVTELLLANGFHTIEVTLRTDGALKSIETIAAEFPEMVCGAGSVLDTQMLEASRNAGARYAVAPAFDDEVIAEALDAGFPFIPGIATPTELLQALEYVDIVKVFPASVLGGVDFIRAVAAPFASREFHLVPTGGVNESNYRDYLAAPPVAACGMSWIVDRKLLAEGNYDELARRMKMIRAGLDEVS